MIEKISTKLLDILAADARLYAGGNAYAAGWSGVKRPNNGSDEATAEYVNLFDRPYDMDGTDHRPGVYLGTKGYEAEDYKDFDVQSDGRIEFRVMIVPLFICVQAPTLTAAKRRRNQLRRNIKVILFSQIVVTDYWYDLEMPGKTGGCPPERVYTTGTGGSSQQVCEGVAPIPVMVRYSWNEDCDA